MAAFTQRRTHTDLLFATLSGVAAAADQWRCAPFVCRSLAEANARGQYLVQRYCALMQGLENDSGGDSMLGGGVANIVATVKANNPAYASATFAEGDVDPGTSVTTEYYELIVGYDPANGQAYCMTIFHIFQSAGGTGGNFGTSTGVNAAPSGTGPSASPCYTRPLNSAVAYTDTGRGLLPVWVDFERSA
jgi:hypothetical protein